MKLLTIVDVQNQQPLPLPQWMYDVEFKLLGRFSYFSYITLIVQILCRSGRVRGEVDIEVVDHIREKFEF